ncbi:MAG: hypothetical protein ACE5GF_06220 [Thermodesulfobacteriota bacterium]
MKIRVHDIIVLFGYLQIDIKVILEDYSPLAFNALQRRIKRNI